jgi:hypothetical protein
LYLGLATKQPLDYSSPVGRTILRERESGMDKFVARENIAHLRDKLATEHDEARLLAEEEAKLAMLEDNQPKKKRD